MNSEHEFGLPSIAPLDRFIAPPGLDGINGINRRVARHKSIAADTDIEAVRLWILSLTDVSESTVVSYRAAAEKLLNWSCFARGKALSSLDETDLHAFVEFLAAPFPTSDWIRRPRVPREFQDWRPFAGPLSLASVRLVLSVISLLFDWLRIVGYASMPSIPGARVVREGFATSGLVANVSARGMTRTLSVKAWFWIKEELSADVDFRIRFVIELMYFANLRLEEIRRLRLADCIAPSNDCAAWRLQLDSMTNCLQCVYLLPPLGESMKQLFEIQSALPFTSLHTLESRQRSELIFDSRNWMPFAIKSVLRRSADAALGGGDSKSAIELRQARLTCFRGALESHSGHDPAFILGFIANAQGSRMVVGKYLRHKILTDEAIKAFWTRLGEHWKTYSDRLTQIRKHRQQC